MKIRLPLLVAYLSLAIPLSGLSAGFAPASCYAQEGGPEPVDTDAAENGDGAPVMPRPPAAEKDDEDEGEEAEEEVAPLPVGANAGAYQPTAAERNSAKSAAALKLAANGRPLVPIVIAAKASGATKKVAGELADFLERITGARFAIQTPDGAPVSLAPAPRAKGVSFATANEMLRTEAEARRRLPAEPLPAAGFVVGTDDEWQVPAGLKEALAMRGVYHGREAFAIRTDAKRLLMLGQDRGLNHAVTRFLNEVGCRWFATGAHWEIIPNMPGLSFGMDITDRPSIGTRIIAFMDGVSNEKERNAQGDWTRRNYLGASFGTSAAHAWHRIAEQNEAVLMQHPEYFALVGGVRRQPTYTDREGKKRIRGVFSKFELANPVVRKMFVDYALNYFRRNPEADMVSLSPTDGGGFSQSEESRKLGSISDAVYGMVNEVARAVAKEFPGKMVGCYAYRETAGPPSFPLEPNVYVEVATLFNMSNYTSQQLLELWPQKAKNRGVYRYFSYYDAGGSELTGGPISSIKWATDAIRSDYARNSAAIFAQSSNAFAMQMRGYLVASRLMWNPQANPDEILADFYDKAYGPAAATMKLFHERAGRDSSQKIIGQYGMGVLYRYLDEATRQAKDRPDVLARLGDLKLYFHWLHLRSVAGSTPAKTVADKAKFAEAYSNMMRAGAIMAPTYMAQWNMILKKTSRRYAPTLKGVVLTDVYKDLPEPTLEYIEENFQRELQQLPKSDVPMVEYDLTDLVPVVFPAAPALQIAPAPKKPAPKAAASAAPDAAAPATAEQGDAPSPEDAASASLRREYYQGKTPLYMFYSFGGEPIEIELKAGARGSQGSAEWRLYKPDGKGGWSTVQKGEIPSDRSTNKLTLKVPGKGLYAVRYSPGSMAGYISYSADKPATVIATGAKDFRGAFIYVPKGTKEIWLSFNHYNGGTQVFLQPDGKTAQRLVAGVYIIPVPAGMDGQLWRFAPGSRFRSQQFLNIPNLAAATPEALMVPRAVALADGLKIRQ